jgi:hypothetical protein
MPTALGAAHFTDCPSTNRRTPAYHLAAVLAIEGNRSDAFSELQYSVENGLPRKSARALKMHSSNRNRIRKESRVLGSKSE